jgi:hypothetical protein
VGGNEGGQEDVAELFEIKGVEVVFCEVEPYRSLEMENTILDLSLVH